MIRTLQFDDNRKLLNVSDKDESDDAIITRESVITRILFEEYLSDEMNVGSAARNRYLLAACFGAVDKLSLEDPPYNNLSRTMLPKQSMLK